MVVGLAVILTVGGAVVATVRETEAEAVPPEPLADAV
jgi:hypothetical protein